MNLPHLSAPLLFAGLLHLLLGLWLSQTQPIHLIPHSDLPSPQPTAIIVHLQPAATTPLSSAPTPAIEKDPTPKIAAQQKQTSATRRPPPTKPRRPRRQPLARQPAPDIQTDAPPKQTVSAQAVSKASKVATTVSTSSPPASTGQSAHRALPTSYLQHLHRLLQRHQYYPRLARQRGEQGTVVVSFDIQPDNRLYNIRLHQATTSKRLNQAALRSVRHLQNLLPPLPAALNRRSWSVKVPVVYQLH